VAGRDLTAYLLPFPFPPVPPTHFQHHAPSAPPAFPYRLPRAPPKAPPQVPRKKKALGRHLHPDWCRAASLSRPGSQTTGLPTAGGPRCCNLIPMTAEADLLYINSPGVSVTAGLAILTHPYVQIEVVTICRRSGGEHGRLSPGGRHQGASGWPCPNSRIMIHQPLGWHQPTPRPVT